MAVSREQIITAAIQHLNTTPAASMAEIAAAAGISRATLHRHFTGRDELVTALGWRALEDWERVQQEAGIAEATASADPARLRETLQALLHGEVAICHEHGFLLTEHTLPADLMRRSDEIEEREVEFLAACQRAGLIRADLPSRWVSTVVFALLVAVRESVRRGDVAQRDVPHLFLGTFLKGIS
ncbi:TetR/AcrR family transcriptional regulator [Planomonospora venezuelensis]|uniref:AcrR family transcriptional regulator n=1 Tax=Planomonospora venezuelensis TaxID=1999 RepID=A0A841DAJ9_PLAVE|nr:TetR family transcriptional regulator [Planomonospora venezuelensis]MBB5967201.1 AcrR family transcriptional regulator [Planomonospora venezuelensis]GIN02970.1 TetR family transcriptional regulator [Planomonospora venezuelensis]